MLTGKAREVVLAVSVRPVIEEADTPEASRNPAVARPA
jgi:hypothetical protein